MLVGMLSCNVQEIEEKIKKELEENPALEKIDRERETTEAESYNSEDEYYNSEYSSDADYRQRENADEMGNFSNYSTDDYDDYSSDNDSSNIFLISSFFAGSTCLGGMAIVSPPLSNCPN